MIYFFIWLAGFFVMAGFLETVDEGDIAGNTALALFWPFSVPVMLCLAVGVIIGRALK